MIAIQFHEMIADLKTQTRRIIKPGEELGPDFGGEPTVFTKQGRIKWQAGRDYAVQPKRGHNGVWYDPNTLNNFNEGTMSYANMEDMYPECPYGKAPQFHRQRMLDAGYVPLRIKILKIRSELLHLITEEDAFAEGVPNIVEYQRLWNSINKRPGTRWVDNPMVWVIDFERMIYS